MFGYDQSGIRTSLTDGEGRTTGYTYDALGRLVAKVYPDSNQALFQYDAKGRMISASNQRTIRYQYDALGNRVKMTTPEGKSVQYSYDAAKTALSGWTVSLADSTSATTGWAAELPLPNPTESAPAMATTPWAD